MSKTIILGMNNPYSSRADTALLPLPRGSAGWNLWQMHYEVSGVSRIAHWRGFEFRNALNDTNWKPVDARKELTALWTSWTGRRVIVCGQAVLKLLWKTRPPVLDWREDAGVTWCSIPHPSGLCREYNDPFMRTMVGMRLAEEWSE